MEMKRHKHPKLRSVSELPVVPGAFYGIDIDGTLLKLVDVTLYSTTHKYESGKPWEYSGVDSVVQHPPDVPFLHHLDRIATPMYITFREPEDEAKTREQLKRAGFPDLPLHFSRNKGITTTEILAAAGETFEEVYFVDDVDWMCDTVKHYVPHAKCYHLCTWADKTS